MTVTEMKRRNFLKTPDPFFIWKTENSFYKTVHWDVATDLVIDATAACGTGRYDSCYANLTIWKCDHSTQHNAFLWNHPKKQIASQSRAKKIHTFCVFSPSCLLVGHIDGQHERSYTICVPPVSTSPIKLSGLSLTYSLVSFSKWRVH